MHVWHPRAKRVLFEDAGDFVEPFNPKIIWHTTEGQTIDGAVAAYRANGGDCPHFTIEPHNFSRKLYQHIRLDRASRSLRHPSGTPETNRAGCIQIEIVGFTADIRKMTRRQYRWLYWLARWIEQNAHVHRAAYHPFPDNPGYHRLSPDGFPTARGHLGHCHVPNNDHMDPGNIIIGRIL